MATTYYDAINDGETILSNTLDIGEVTSFVVNDGSQLPVGGAGTSGFIIKLEDTLGNREYIKCSSRSGNTVYIANRGFEGTFARTWISGSYLKNVWTKATKDEITDKINAVDSTLNSHLAERTSEIISTTRDLSVTGLQVIPTTVNKPIKSIQAFAEVNNTIKWSQGFVDESGLKRSQYLMSNGSYASHDNSILMISQTMTTDRIYATPTIGTGTFSLNWVKVGAGATGILNMHFLITYHGD